MLESPAVRKMELHTPPKPCTLSGGDPQPSRPLRAGPWHRFHNHHLLGRCCRAPPAQTRTRLQLCTHAGSAPGAAWRRPVSRLEQRALCSPGGGGALLEIRGSLTPPRAAGRLHGAVGRSASPGGLEVRGPHPGLEGQGRGGRVCIPGWSPDAQNPGGRCGHPCAQRPYGSLWATQNQNITFC